MKTEFKGTQGKWEVVNDPTVDYIDGIYYEGFAVVYDLGRKQIANVPAYEFWGQTFETAKANAKLISKAPEMLGMLMNYINDLKNIVPQSDARDNRIYQVEKLIKEATEI